VGRLFFWGCFDPVVYLRQVIVWGGIKMYGIVNKALKSMIVKQQGEAVWQQVLEKSGLDNPIFIGTDSYPDQMTYQLVGTVCEVLQRPPAEVLESFGYFWATHTAVEEYPELMETGGGTMEDFLKNLPNFHTQITLMLPRLEPPDFRCEEIAPGCLHMHYFSHREGLALFALGILKGLATVFTAPVEVTQWASKGQNGADHDIFQVKWMQDTGV
jgi:hypothetical protein